MRAIRKTTSYVCTRCFTIFPSGKDARAHVKAAHPAGAEKPTRRRGPTTVNRIVQAIEGGATTAKDVQKKTGLPLNRVHSFLTYLRKRGRVKGDASSLRVTKKGSS